MRNFRNNRNVGLAFLLAGLAGQGVVYADDHDVLNVVAGTSVLHDNNIFRVPSNVNMLSIAGKSDRSDLVTTTYAGVRVDKPYSLQRFKFEYLRTAYRYQNYKFLEFDADEYKAAWLWSLTPYLTGNLSVDRTQALNNFQDYRNYSTINIRTTENKRFDADWSPYGNWHLLTGVSRYTATNSQAFNEDSDYSQDTLNAGLKYVFPSGTSVSVVGYGRRGIYDKRDLDVINLYDTGFSERQLDVSLNWVLTGKSRINFKVGEVIREHDHVERRDYSEPFGALSYIWTPTGKTQVTASLTSEVASFQTSTSSFTRIDTFAVSPVWMVSDKVMIRGSGSFSSRKFEGDGVVGLPDVGRRDMARNLSASVSWKPFRVLNIDVGVQKSERNSNLNGLDFEDTSATISGQLTF